MNNQSINQSIISLCSDFNALNISEPLRKDYPQARLVQGPIGQPGLKVDSLFLRTHEGEVLSQVTRKLIKCKRLNVQSEKKFYERVNRWFLEGTCYGEAHAFMLSCRPKEPTKKWGQKERVNAIFFHLYQDIYYHQKKDLEEQLCNIVEKTRQVRQQVAVTAKKLTKLQAEKFNLATKCNMLLKKPGPPEPCKLVRQELSTKIKKINAYSLLIKTLEQDIIKLRKKGGVLHKKINELKNFVSQFDAERTRKLVEKGLKVQNKLFYKKNNRRQKGFVEYFIQGLFQALCDKSLSDFFLSFHFPKQTLTHWIVVQPRHTYPRIYDSQHGELRYENESHIIEDIKKYCLDKKVDWVELRCVGAQQFPLVPTTQVPTIQDCVVPIRRQPYPKLPASSQFEGCLMLGHKPALPSEVLQFLASRNDWLALRPKTKIIHILKSNL